MDTSTYFPLLNPLILVQSRALGEIQPLSMAIEVSPSPCSGLRSLPAQLHLSPTPGQEYTPGPWSHGQIPFPPLTRFGTGTERWPEPTGFWKDPQRLSSSPWAAASAALPGLPAQPGRLSCSFPLSSLPLCTAGASL